MIPAAELAAICYDPGDPARSDLDLWSREIRRVRGQMCRSRIRGAEWQILVRRIGVPVGWLMLMAAHV